MTLSEWLQLLVLLLAGVATPLLVAWLGSRLNRAVRAGKVAAEKSTAADEKAAAVLHYQRVLIAALVNAGVAVPVDESGRDADEG